jgi:hypothetical protein
MSYVLIDSNDNTFDLASNKGIDEIYDAGPDLLKKLLDDGELLEDEIQELAEELEGGPLQYIADLLQKVEGDVILSNGIEDEAAE